jgi:hypothetical protein
MKKWRKKKTCHDGEAGSSTDGRLFDLISNAKPTPLPKDFIVGGHEPGHPSGNRDQLYFRMME